MKYLTALSIFTILIPLYFWFSGQPVPAWLRIVIFAYLLAATVYVGILAYWDRDRNRKG